MILYFETLQNDFLSRSKDFTNKKLYTQNELNQIDTFLNHNDFDVSTTYLIDDVSNNYRPKIEIIKTIYFHVRYGWDTFFEAYQNYYNNEVENEFTEFKKTSDITESELQRFNEQYKEYHVQGLEFGKYVLWLKRHENKNVLSKPITGKLTNKQKLLALYYLGLKLNSYDKTKIAKILSQVLEIGENNIRINLSSIHGKNKEVRTLENLTKTSELFENVGITEISSKIKAEIENM